MTDSNSNTNTQRVWLLAKTSMRSSEIAKIKFVAFAEAFTRDLLLQAGEVTSCIAQISTSLELVILVKQLKPSLDLAAVNLDFNQLQIEIHEGALVPGILLPAIKFDARPDANSKSSALSLGKDVVFRCFCDDAKFL